MKGKYILQFLVLTFINLGFAAPVAKKTAEERIVLHTDAGDIVLALYPDVAPKHVEQLLRLAKLRAFDGIHFYRVHTGFLAQLSTVEDRLTPLTEEQRRAIKKIPAEFSTISHQYGQLTMARQDNDVDSAETSFSIMLGSAPHLDGKYTIFGFVEDGFESVNEFLKVPQGVNHDPVVRLTVNQAEVIKGRPLLIAKARPIVVPPNLNPATDNSKKLSVALAVGLLLIILNSILTFFFSAKFSRQKLKSLVLINVLIAGFLILLVALPSVKSTPILSALTMLGILAMFRLMTQFEMPDQK